MRHFGVRAWGPVLLLTLLVVGGPAGYAQSDEEKGTNKLKGVVVCKKSGQPLEGVSIGMVHAEEGYMSFSEPGSVTATGWGTGETVLWFFKKANTQTAVNAETDEDGRFTLSGFTSPHKSYHLGVAHPEYGAAMRLNLKPREYRDRELRIELEEPSFIRTDDIENESLAGTKMRCHTRLELVVLPKDGTEEKKEQPPTRVRVWEWPAEYGADVDEEDPEDIEARLEREKPGFVRYGPLPAGHQYRLRVYARSRTMPDSATIFERLITLEAGRTVEVRLKDLPGATVSGRLTDTDGKPLRFVNVLIKCGPGDELVLGAITDKDGQYEIKGVPAGEHKLELLRYAKHRPPG